MNDVEVGEWNCEIPRGYKRFKLLLQIVMTVIECVRAWLRRGPERSLIRGEGKNPSGVYTQRELANSPREKVKKKYAQDGMRSLKACLDRARRSKRSEKNERTFNQQVQSV